MKLMLVLAAVLAFPSLAGADILNPPGGPVYEDDAAEADVPVMPANNPRMDRPQRMERRDRAPRDPQRVAKRQQLRRALISQFDANGDGRLGPRERMRAARVLRRIENRLTQPRQGNRAGQYRKIMQRYDVNGDGQVGPREVPRGAADRLRRFDRNQDGWVEPGEL
ncbi:MAG: hypothetical protein H0V17_24790 [Deltaproteobacteria bacterium]|nr:hypothetical protein [Deltaproteobacteria bacterium]